MEDGYEMSALVSLVSEEAWEVVVIPLNVDVFACRYTFIPKYEPDETIDWYKARLVVNVLTLTSGVD